MTAIPTEKLTPSAVQAAALFGPDGIDREVWQPMAAAVVLSEHDRVALVPPESGRGAELPLIEIPVKPETRQQSPKGHTVEYLSTLLRGMWAGHLQARSIDTVHGVLTPGNAVFTQPLNDPSLPMQMVVPFVIRLRGQPQLKAGTWHPLDSAARQVGGRVLGRTGAFRNILTYLVDYPSSCRR